MSKRVLNARSAAHYKRNGPAKRRIDEQQDSIWSGLRAKLSTHPVVFALVAFMMLFSGIATFWMNDRHNRSMFA